MRFCQFPFSVIRRSVSIPWITSASSAPWWSCQVTICIACHSAISCWRQILLQKVAAKFSTQRRWPGSGHPYYKPTKLQNTKGICHWRWLGHSILHDAPDSLIRSVLTSSANLCFLRWNIYAILWINSLIIKSTNFFIFYIPLECCKVYLTYASSKRFRPTDEALQYPYLNTKYPEPFM